MIAVASAGRIYLRRAPTDMRKSFDGLSGIVRGELGRDPLSGDLFVFVRRTCRAIRPKARRSST